MLPRQLSSVSEALSVRVCVDGACSQNEYATGAELPAISRQEGPDADEVRVSAEIRSTQGVVARLSERRIKLEKLRPNGPRCGPTCHQGRVKVPLIGN
jgi:hypothetical protein